MDKQFSNYFFTKMLTSMISGFEVKNDTLKKVEETLKSDLKETHIKIFGSDKSPQELIKTVFCKFVDDCFKEVIPIVIESSFSDANRHSDSDVEHSEEEEEENDETVYEEDPPMLTTISPSCGGCCSHLPSTPSSEDDIPVLSSVKSSDLGESSSEEE